MTVEAWLTAAIADAERRALPALRPLLETLARSTAALRAADAELRSAAVGSTGSGEHNQPHSANVR